MPPRSAKMKRRILGFQRRVWWPKWTPASSRSRIETAPAFVETAMEAPSRLVLVVLSRRKSRRTSREERHARHGWAAGEWERDAGRLAAGSFERGGEVRRERRGDVDVGARNRVREGQPRSVEELPLEAEISCDSIGPIAGYGQVDR